MKVLLNAEAFGFGPCAAMVEIFKHIKTLEIVTQIDYVGDSHTLDLHSKLPYNKVFNVKTEKDFKKIVQNYDIFITALDFEKAMWAIEEEIKTVVYDTLLWYWRKIPPVLNKTFKYITQNFYGVKERLEQTGICNGAIIPPLVQKMNHKTESNVKDLIDKDLILINFGGLQNPYWAQSTTLDYISIILELILPLLKHENVKIACSKIYEPYLIKYGAKNYSYDQMQEYLQKSRLVIATPGLGNIYECANYDIPSLFLPPVNDSQGQQLKILINKGQIDNYIDWDFFELPLEYNLEQLEVLDYIKNNIKIVKNKIACSIYKENLKTTINSKIIKSGNTNLKNLIGQFGINGIEQLKFELNAIFLKEE